MFFLDVCNWAPKLMTRLNPDIPMRHNDSDWDEVKMVYYEDKGYNKSDEYFSRKFDKNDAYYYRKKVIRTNYIKQFSFINRI